jgi:hypothetical protein
MGIGNIIFIVVLLGAIIWFSKNVLTISRNIKLGKDLDRSDRKGERWSTMARIALGQSKMVKKPISGVLHILVYAGFIIINIEVLEINIDGVLTPVSEFISSVGDKVTAAIAGIGSLIGDITSKFSNLTNLLGQLNDVFDSLTSEIIISITNALSGLQSSISSILSCR